MYRKTVLAASCQLRGLPTHLRRRLLVLRSLLLLRLSVLRCRLCLQGLLLLRRRFLSALVSGLGQYLMSCSFEHERDDKELQMEFAAEGMDVGLSYDGLCIVLDVQ